MKSTVPIIFDQLPVLTITNESASQYRGYFFVGARVSFGPENDSFRLTDFRA